MTKLPMAELAQLAASSARLAGEYIAAQRHQPQVNLHKQSGVNPASQALTEIDLYCEKLIAEQLAESCQCYDLAYLSEESAELLTPAEHPRHSKDYFWCVDPLDGTLPFLEGRDGFAVSIALVSRCGEPILGAIYQPTTRLSWLAYQEPEQERWQLQTPPVQAKRSESLRAVFDSSVLKQDYFPELERRLTQLAAKLGYSGVAVSSGAGAVMHACQVLQGEADCYFKLAKPQAGGGSLWDYAASAALFKAKSYWVSAADGSALDLNRSDSNYMNHQGVLYCRSAELAKAIQAICEDLS